MTRLVSLMNVHKMFVFHTKYLVDEEAQPALSKEIITQFVANILKLMETR